MRKKCTHAKEAAKKYLEKLMAMDSLFENLERDHLTLLTDILETLHMCAGTDKVHGAIDVS